MSEIRLNWNDKSLELWSTKKGLLITIKGEQNLQNFFKEFEKAQEEIPKCNNGHKFCEDWHTI